ncbi:MAG: nickel-type superoxide dismutase maturation protease [Candidatus Promineifilaceae bacterium]|jgi:nickel-type superoxide dismutase maturation protease
MLADPLPESGTLELLLWILRLRRRMRVSGASMIPTLAEDDEVLVDTRAYANRFPNVGEIVVAHRPDRRNVVLVKRVTEVRPNGRILLLGDNPAASTDSLEFGPITLEHLIGKVTSRFA